MKKILVLLLYIVPFTLPAQNSYFNIGPIPSPVPLEGRLSISGSAAEVSLLNRSATSFIQDPTNGERWSIYNDGKLNFWSGADKMTLTHDGKLGVGIAAPLDMLHVNGNISHKT